MGGKSLVSMLMLLSIFSSLGGAQEVNDCSELPTIMEIIRNDPELSLTNSWAENVKSDVLLSSPNINVTLLLIPDPIMITNLYDYIGQDTFDASSVGVDKEAAVLAVYGSIRGKYSPENLTAIPSVNSFLGILRDQDYVFRMYMDETTGQLTAQGLTPGNTVKVTKAIEACNGYVYVTENMVLPAINASMIASLPGDGAKTAQFYIDGLNCTTSVPRAVGALPDTEKSTASWEANGLVQPLSDNLLASTIFVPQDSTLLYANSTSTEASLYRMLPGEWCPDELAAAGSKNSMLGEIIKTNIPLKFSKDEAGNLLVSDGTLSARVVNRTTACHSLVYIIDQPLMPPDDTREDLLTPPSTLPSKPIRWVTCNSVVYMDNTSNPASGPDTFTRASSMVGSGSESGVSTSSSSSVALAVGLGVGLGAAVLLCVGAVFYARSRRKKAAFGELLGSSKSSSPKDGSSDDIKQSLGSVYDPNQLIDSGNSSTIWNSIPATAIFSGAGVDTMHFTTRAELNNTSKPAPIVAIHTKSGTMQTVNTQLSRLSPTAKGASLWEIDPTDVTVSLDEEGRPIELGRGSYGAVYRGTVRGVQPAAIKVLNEGASLDAEAAFRREAAILKHVNRDRNVVQLYGTSRMPDGKLLLITELLEGGDLRKALNHPVLGEELLWQKMGKSVALDVARGLVALHANSVIHRDIKSKNVLLTDTFTAKIADVGIAAVHSQGYLTASAGQVVGTLAWSAPELLMGQRCTEKVDIFSLGVLLWELATGDTPKRGFLNLPPASERCPKELIDLIRECTESKAKNRPTAKQVYDKILSIPPVLDC